ncbi:hypothetical protein [Neptunitalea lumnitzerae]|uniref:Uncharacterized protein n=1 Tax=Neptunitalea lumnitzerae TaxID=2965509 RepID=A0ABQ5MKX3_9FLAO|nr:hypothetical protein [Neptunitalea sp. Y10]GLB50061.1 hypothetical protein Y10_24290 [Neptunitalea sp. Y10]
MRLDKDNIDTLFDDLQGSFDVHEPSQNHMKNFEAMLAKQSTKSTAKNSTIKNRRWWYVAASILIVIAVSIGVFNGTTKQKDELATVAPELYQSQTYFTGIINQELEKLQKEDTSPETKEIVNDAVKQINKLEKDYSKLKADLLENGADKRVIYAMITNLQKRIELLQHVLQTIDDVKTLKTETHEII